MLSPHGVKALGILVTGRLVAGGGNDVLAKGARWSLIAGRVVRMILDVQLRSVQIG
jgi:hypothetical protein